MPCADLRFFRLFDLPGVAVALRLQLLQAHELFHIALFFEFNLLLYQVVYGRVHPRVHGLVGVHIPRRLLLTVLFDNNTRA